MNEDTLYFGPWPDDSQEPDNKRKAAGRNSDDEELKARQRAVRALNALAKCRPDDFSFVPVHRVIPDGVPLFEFLCTCERLVVVSDGRHALVDHVKIALAEDGPVIVLNIPENHEPPAVGSEPQPL